MQCVRHDDYPQKFQSTMNLEPEQEEFYFKSTQRRLNYITGWYYSLLLIGVATLSYSDGHPFLLFDGCMITFCVCGWTDAADGAAFLFSYLYLATAMIRRDNAFSLLINSAWRPTSTSTMDGFGRAKFKDLFGVNYLHYRCGVVRYWKKIIYRVEFCCHKIVWRINWLISLGHWLSQ